MSRGRKEDRLIVTKPIKRGLLKDREFVVMLSSWLNGDLIEGTLDLVSLGIHQS